VPHPCVVCKGGSLEPIPHAVRLTIEIRGTHPFAQTAKGRGTSGSGNLLADTFHTYTWDSFNKLSTVDSSACGSNGECVTYDAQGRAVEVSNNNVYTQIWYTQLGKTAFMRGSTIQFAYAPVPGGGTAYIGQSTGNYQYMHKDWLGSARIISYVNDHTVYLDQAFAPYGETYQKFGSAVSSYSMFTGDTQDIVAGTYETPNRELNPNQGRWLSPDPAGAGWNLYAYSTNPNGSVDASGLSATIYPLNGSGGWDWADQASSGDFAGTTEAFGTVAADADSSTDTGTSSSGSTGTLNMNFSAGAAALVGLAASSNDFDLSIPTWQLDPNAQEESLTYNVQVLQDVVFPVGPISELPSFLEGFEAEQGFSGVIDTSTGEVAVSPSTYGEPVPYGFVPANGGHADVSAELWGNPANQSGFSMVLQENGSVELGFKSGVLNAGPDNLASPEVQQQIIQWVQQQGVVVFKP